MAAQESSDLELVEEFADEDLQRALALSLQECSPAVAAGAVAAVAAAVERDQQTQQGPAGEQQEGNTGGKKRARQPMRGRRLQPQSPQQQAAAQSPQQQPAPAAPSTQATPGKLGSEAPAQRAAPPSRGKAQPTQPSPAAAAAAAAKPSGSRQPRKRKLPAFNPSDAEVESCFASLAAGSSVITVESLVEVSQAVGGDLSFAGGKNMMVYAAGKVLGWGSGAGRVQSAKGVLSLPAFRQIIDHFRI